MKKDSYSFEGQDKILESLLRDTKQGFYIDVGCNHPINNNNTFSFYKKKWSGICIDMHYKFKILYLKNRKRDKFICACLSNNKKTLTANYFEDDTNTTVISSWSKRYEKRIKKINMKKVQSTTLNEILSINNIPNKFELLKIDAEGSDFNILKGINLKKYIPKVIQIEIRNLKLENFTKNQVVKYLKEFNYSLIAKTPYDSFFVSKRNPIKWIPQKLY